MKSSAPYPTPQHREATAAPEQTLPENCALSVIIPAFNESKYIEKTIKSVLRASERYAGPVEVIVVDNNSTDGTDEIASRYDVKVVFEPKNQIARARNAGAEVASGECLVFLDADTTINGEIFNKVSRHFSSGSVIGGGAWVVPDSSWFGRLVFFLINYVLLLKNVTVGPFLYCDRKAFVEVGGFDEALYAGEEFSLARRLKEEGKKQQKKWKIIKYSSDHKIVTSSRKFQRFGGLEMAAQNVHLVWNTDQKFKQKSQCRFWYEGKR